MPAGISSPPRRTALFASLFDVCKGSLAGAHTLPSCTAKCFGVSQDALLQFVAPQLSVLDMKHTLPAQCRISRGPPQSEFKEI